MEHIVFTACMYYSFWSFVLGFAVAGVLFTCTTILFAHMKNKEN